jgi:RNA polymerase sigma factor (sigma-70 family)
MAKSYPSEKALINDCIAGDKDAWDQFVEKYTNLIYHTAISVLKKNYADHQLYDELEDIHNGIFLALIENNYKKLRQYQGINGCSVSSWLVTVVTNYTLNFIERRKDTISLDSTQSDDDSSLMDTISDEGPTPFDRVAESEQYELLHELMEGLNAKDKLFFKYFYEDDLPPEEIASLMNVSVSTIYSTKSRIIKKLKNLAKKKNLLQEN